MNCLDFRRRTTIDPLADDAELMAHEAQCHGCAAYAREIRAQEIRLRAALNDVAPPAGLAERVVLAARYEQQAGHRRRWWYGAAASLLLMVGVSMVTVFQNAHHRGQQDLVQSVLKHITDEAHHLHEVSAVSRGRLHWTFERFGARLVGDIGRVNFAAECLMRHRNGVHLVLPGRMGPITVFYMPGEMIEGAVPVASEQMAGRIVPTAWGSVAVVGEIGEELDGLGERLAGAVEWPSTAVAATPVVEQRHIAGRVVTRKQQDG